MTEKQNKYDIKEDYVIGYTGRGNQFYFDLEDFDKVKQYYWTKRSTGEIVCKESVPELSMHKLIMGDGAYIHKNGNRNDNRKDNLAQLRNYYNDGKVYLNGYISIYMPEHERAFDNGCVYEHVLVAEQILGRKLKQKEVVHHKDKDRTNNSLDNLMVFQTEEDHIAFHGGAECIQDNDGTYYCVKKFLKFTYYYRDRTRRDIDNNVIDVGSVNVKMTASKDICPYCEKNFKELKAEMCNECWKKEQSKHIPPKEEIEALIYELPFTKIGKR